MKIPYRRFYCKDYFREQWLMAVIKFMLIFIMSSHSSNSMYHSLTTKHAFADRASGKCQVLARNLLAIIEKYGICVTAALYRGSTVVVSLCYKHTY